MPELDKPINKKIIMNVFEKFTDLYSVSKTLRLGLKPIGRTLEYIEKKGIIAQDAQRADE